MRIDLAHSGPVTALESTPPRHIAVIGNAMPRRCGLATYTSHSVEAFAAVFPATRIDHYAMDDGHGAIVYPPHTRTIAQQDFDAYAAAALAIDGSGAQLIWVQHEFGIFGGPAGGHLLHLLDHTALPVVATLHTLLTNPGPDEDRVFRALIARCDRLVVMARRGRSILIDTYGVDPSRIDVVSHGVPDRALVATAQARSALGLPNQPSIMTFGLLAPNKGIETMLDALPAIVAARPDVLYYVLGATHPAVKRDQGEAYREALMARAETLGVAAHVRLVDRFFDEEDLLDWLQAADVYATPYQNPQQITSGALSYAVGMGKPVVSTPYVHACEILDEDHGIIVPFGDSGAFARHIGQLLDDDTRRLALARKAWKRGQTMVWARNAVAMADVMATTLAARTTKARTRFAVPDFARFGEEKLMIDLSAIDRMTDGTGMLQHGIHRVPDRNHGYCIDDNARALIFACRVRGELPEEAERLATVYAAFVQHGWNEDAQSFRNFMGYDRRWLEDRGSDDSNGRTMWALGVAAASAPTLALRDWALDLYNRAMPMAAALESPRAAAFAILGAAALLDALPDHAASRQLVARNAALLTMLVTRVRRPDWAWFETVLAYDNARLPEALLRAAAVLDDAALTATGLETLDWIIGQQTAKRGHFRPVGSESFGAEYAPPRPFDQQPLEAYATVDACDAAFALTQDLRWIAEAQRAFAWFAGGNDLALPLASSGDGGCFDGLTPQGVNRNQGAESILALQLATCAMQKFPQQIQAETPLRIPA